MKKSRWFWLVSYCFLYGEVFADVTWENFQENGGEQFDLHLCQVTFLPVGNGYETLKSDLLALPLSHDNGRLLEFSDETFGIAIDFEEMSTPIPFFDQRETKLFATNDGRIVFGNDFATADQERSTTNHFQLRQIAPFWTDADHTEEIRLFRFEDRLAISLKTKAPLPSVQMELFYDGRIRFSYEGKSNTDALVGISPGGQIFNPENDLEDDLSDLPEMPVEILIHLRDEIPIPDSVDVESFGDFFGDSAAVSGDLIAVGAPGHDSDASGINGDEGNDRSERSGAVYVFSKIDGVWRKEAFIKSPHPDIEDRFGDKVALYGDTLVVGCDREDGAVAGINGDSSDNSLRDAGAVFVFRRNDGNWSQEAYLKASNPDERDFFGTSIALHKDTLAVSAIWESSASNDQNDNSAPKAGAVYLFERNDEVWTQTDYLKSSSPDDDRFGSSIALSDNYLAVGATSEDGGIAGVNGDESDNSVKGSGAAYVFSRSEGSWQQEAYLKASHPDIDDRFGFSVAISGETVAVGANEEDGGQGFPSQIKDDNSDSQSGAVYLFKRDETGQWTESFYLKKIDPSIGQLGSRVDLDETFVFASGGDALFARQGDNWIAQEFYRREGQSRYERFPREGGNSYFDQNHIVSPKKNGIFIFETEISANPVKLIVRDEADLQLQNRKSVVEFPLTEVWSGNSTKTFSITNEGSFDLTNLKIELTNEFEGDFAIDFGDLESGLAVGQSKTINLGFAPNGIRRSSAELKIISTINPVHPTIIYLAGMASGPRSQAEVAYLKSDQPRESRQFGRHVAISGNTLLIGARRENVTQPDGSEIFGAGKVYVYELGESGWELVDFITPDLSLTDDQFGNGVAIDGDLAVIGGKFIRLDGETPQVDRRGTAYVFERVDGVWTQRAILQPPQLDPFDLFGSNIAISGELIAISSSREDSAASGINGDTSDDSLTDSGAVFLFEHDGQTWKQTTYFKSPDPDFDDLFGNAIALDGDRLAVGCLREDSGSRGSNGDPFDNSAESSGAVFLFTKQEGAWVQEAYLKSSNSDEGDNFGAVLDLSGDDLIVSAIHEDSEATGLDGDGENNSAQSSGAVYHFKKLESGWQEIAYLKSSNSDINDLFGISISLEGNVLVVGAPSEDSIFRGVNTIEIDNDGVGSGAAYVFILENGQWSQLAYLKSSNSEGSMFSDSSFGDGFGASLAISGSTIVVGSVSEDSGDFSNPEDNSQTDSGAAYLFNLEILDGTILPSRKRYDQAAKNAGLAGRDAQPDATPFLDGASNLLKYASNLSLEDRKPIILPQGGSGLPSGSLVGKANETFFRFEYLRRKGSGLQYTPYFSFSMTDESFVEIENPPTIQPINLFWERATIDLPLSSNPQEKAFLRLGVEFRN